MLVVTILGILSAAAVLAFRGDDLTVDAAARGLVADAMQAQQLAIETRQPIGLRFDLVNNACKFVLADGRTPKEAETTLRTMGTLSTAEVEILLEARASGDPTLSRGRFTGVSLGGGTDLLFDPDGTPRQVGWVEVGAGNERLRVHVQTGAGRLVITQP